MACRARLAGLWRCSLSGPWRWQLRWALMFRGLLFGGLRRTAMTTPCLVDHGEWGSGQLSASVQHDPVIWVLVVK